MVMFRNLNEKIKMVLRKKNFFKGIFIIGLNYLANILASLDPKCKFPCLRYEPIQSIFLMTPNTTL